MRNIETAVPNIEPGSADYPNGRIKNAAVGVNGTAVVEELYGDPIQFFQKLIIEAGITVNNQPDNVTNGYQLFEALVEVIKANPATNAALVNAVNAFTQEQRIGVSGQDEQLRIGHAAIGVNPMVTFWDNLTELMRIRYNTTNSTIEISDEETNTILRITDGEDGLTFETASTEYKVFHEGNFVPEHYISKARTAGAVSGSNINIDWFGRNDFKNTDLQNLTLGAYNVNYIADSSAESGVLYLRITSVSSAVLTFPSGTRGPDSDTRWEGTTLQYTVPGAGVPQTFKLALNRIGSTTLVELSDSF